VIGPRRRKAVPNHFATIPLGHPVRRFSG